MNNSFIQIHEISKHFGSVRAVDNVSFQIHEGEFFSLLGPSGCGKTTLLRLLAGFEFPTNGKLLLDEVSLIIFDEAHHAPSKYFSKALPIINCKKSLALC